MNSIVVGGIVSFALQIALTIFGWIRIPDDARIAMQWGISGRPNWYAPKPIGLLAVPAVTLIIGALIAARTGEAPTASYLFGFAVLLGAHALIVFMAVK